MDFSESEIAKFELADGDVLVCEGGEVGRAAIWHDDVPGCCFQKALHRVRPHRELMVEYFVMVLRWLAYRNELAPHVTGSTIAHLPQEDLRLLEIPVPLRAEQEAIVERVRSALESVDRMRDTAAQATRQGERLRRAILDRAMRGELVPQDPRDEPASLLLKRIAAERAAAPKAPRKRREKTPA
jgi:type I restriction enzyme S subunit